MGITRHEASQLLSVAANAPARDVRDAYQRLARQYHADRLEHLRPEFTELAKAKMVAINQAYEVLRVSGGKVLPFVDDVDVSEDMELIFDDDTEEEELALEYASVDDDIELEWTDH